MEQGDEQNEYFCSKGAVLSSAQLVLRMKKGGLCCRRIGLRMNAGCICSDFECVILTSVWIDVEI